MYVEECARMGVFLSGGIQYQGGNRLVCWWIFLRGAILCDGCIFCFPLIEWRPANAQKKTYNRTRVYKKEKKKKKNCLLNDRRIEFLSHYLLTCSASLIFNGEEVKFDDGWYLIEMKSLMDVGPILPPQLLLLHSSDMAPSAVFFSFLLCRSCDCRLKRRQQETTIVPGQKFSIFLVSIFISVLACQHSLINPQKRNRMTTGIQDNNKKSQETW